MPLPLACLHRSSPHRIPGVQIGDHHILSVVPDPEILGQSQRPAEKERHIGQILDIRIRGIDSHDLTVNVRVQMIAVPAQRAHHAPGGQLRDLGQRSVWIDTAYQVRAADHRDGEERLVLF